MLFCQRALTERRTLSGGGAPQRGNLRLLEDGSECGGALESDVVFTETAGEGRSEDGERAVVSRGADRKANTRVGGGALERGHCASFERLAQLGDALSVVGAEAILVEAAELVESQAAKGRRSVNGRRHKSEHSG